MKYGLSNDQLSEVIAFIERYPEVERAILFGSRAMDTYKEASDVDIAILGDKVTDGLAAKIKLDFEEDTYLPFYFDIIAYPTITNGALKGHIDHKGIVIFRRGWREFRLGEIADVIDSLHQTPKYTTNGYSMVRVTDIKKGALDLSKTLKVDKETFEKFSKNHKPRLGDIVFSRVGSYGNVVIVKNNSQFCLGQNTAFIVPHQNPEFMFYFLNSPDGKHEIESSVAGSTQATISLKSIKEIKVLLPSPFEQKSIAAVLSSLDDKIDLLHRQNKTLEGMAEALFREWFVNSKMRSESKNLLEVIELVGGGTPKTEISEYWDGDIPWLAGGDITSNHKSFVVNSDKKITNEGLKNCSAKLLPQFATVISARGTVGKYTLLAKPMAYSQSNYGILPRVKNCFFFTYLLINHVVSELQSSAYGSVFDTITTATFKNIILDIPADDEVIKFEVSISEYFNKNLNNQIQIQTLEKIRDTLLPKLMSGEVRVTE